MSVQLNVRVARREPERLLETEGMMMLFAHRAKIMLVLFAVMVLGVPIAAHAAWPEKPIRIVVAFAPGGAADMLARMVAAHLTEQFDQPVVVENRPGASGNIGAGQVARSAPDGYTLMMTWGGMVVNPYLYTGMTYDPLVDLRGVTPLVNAPLVLVVNDTVPAKTFQEYVAFVKSQPGKVIVANGGSGTAQHLGAAYLDLTAKMESVHLPYKGSAPATVDLLGGQVHAMLDNMVTHIPNIKAGKIRALVVTSASRVPVLPDVPTAAESGLPGFRAGSWYGLVAPAKTPDEIVDKLNAAIAELMKTSAVQERMAKMGLEPVSSSPREYDAFMRAEHEKAGMIVKAANVKVE